MRHLWFAVLLIAAGAQAQGAYPPQSIYNLSAKLTSQSGVEHGLDVYHGHPVLITMFYGSCPAACPMLIDTLRSIERSMPAQERSNLRVLLVSIDPERDTVKSLQDLAQARHIELARWTVATTDAANVRKIAAMLNVQYRRLPDGSYNHSSIISVLTPDGVIAKQSSVLGKADEDLLVALHAARAH